MIKMKFPVEMRCNKYLVEKTDENDEGTKVDLTMNLDFETASMFLLRYMPYSFLCNGFKVLLKFDEFNKLNGITLFKDKYIYIVLNTEQVLINIFKGLLKLGFFQKMDTIMEFDFDAAVDLISTPEDEF